MTQIDTLEKLASTGVLKHEPPVRDEIAGLLRTAAVRVSSSPLSARHDVLPRPAHAPRPLARLDEGHARRAPAASKRPDLAFIHL